MNKKGISLIILIITIVLIIILLGITTAGIGNAIQNARMTSFGEDLNLIEDAVNVYYEQNGDFPKVNDNVYVYSNGTLTSEGENITLDSNYVSDFEQELVKNYDLSDGESVVSDTVFYIVDLSKIDVRRTNRGTGKNGNTDVYVMSYPTQTIYYLKGVIADDKIYFSLANISDTKKVTYTSSSDQTIQSLAGVTVTRSKKAWSNTVGVNISANLASSSEELYVKVPVRNSEIKLSTTVGDNDININTLKGSLNLTDTEVSDFNNLDQSEKYINVIKKVSGVETANIKVNLSNLDITAPTFPLKSDGVTYDFTIESLEGYNKVSYTGSDDLSGIKEVRYIYLTEFGRNAKVNTLVEDTSTLTSKFMLDNGYKAYVSDNDVEIKLPKDVEGIYITMYDKAGNYVSMQKNVETDPYIGINPLYISNNLKFNIVVKSESDIDNAKVSISFDNISYLDEKTLTFTKNNNIYSSNVEFENTKQKNVYIKVTTYDTSYLPVETTRIKKFDLTEVAAGLISYALPGQIYEENRYYTDKNGDTAIVPAGFMVSIKDDEQTIDDGMVIIDKLDNEFVWIPVDGINVTYTKKFNEYPKYYEITSVSDVPDELPDGVDENEQITKDAGFYIGRYEAGVPANQTTIDGASASTSNVEGIPQSKKGVTVWTRVSYTIANINAKKLYDNDNVKSGLLTGTMWDTACQWIENSGKSVTDSSTWGNHSDSKSPANVTGYNSKQVTGFSEYWKAKNIYDLAGNVCEWTNEAYSTNRICRGGSFYRNGNEYSVSYLHFHNGTDDSLGFRIALYIM